MTRLSEVEDWEFARALMSEADGIISPLERIADALEALVRHMARPELQSNLLVRDMIANGAQDILIWWDNPTSVGLGLLAGPGPLRDRKMVAEAHQDADEPLSIGLGRLAMTRMQDKYALNPDELPF